jgi:hypothetical protein
MASAEVFNLEGQAFQPALKSLCAGQAGKPHEGINKFPTDNRSRPISLSGRVSGHVSGKRGRDIALLRSHAVMGAGCVYDMHQALAVCYLRFGQAGSRETVSD